MRKVIHWVVFVAVVLQFGSCVFRGQSHMPEVRSELAVPTAAG